MQLSILATSLLAATTFAAPALAQTEPTAGVYLTHDDPDGLLHIGETVTWTLAIAFENAEVASGGNMEVLGNNNLGFSSSMSYGMTNGGNNGGDSNGAGIGFVNWTNSLFIEAFGQIADHRNPYHVGSFTFTATTYGTLEYTLTGGIAPSAFLSLGINAFSDHLFENSEEVAIYSDTLTIVPAPATALLLAPAALLAGKGGRRRR